MQKMYRVAGHLFSIEMSRQELLWGQMSPYLPFECETSGEGEIPLFTLRVVREGGEVMRLLPEGEEIIRFNDDMARFCAWRLPGGKYRVDVGISGMQGENCLIADQTGNAQLVISSNLHLQFFGLNNALMLLYTRYTSPKDTLLIHASVIKYRGHGYLFQGKSGTGKSTHSRLWLENIPETELLNDDNPAVRVIDEKVMIYGTPWSGKTPCYKNEGVPLGALVRIIQAPQNEIEHLPALKSYASLFPSCSCIRWEKEQQEFVHRTIEKVIMRVACYNLKCLPDADAAWLCNRTIVQ